MDHTLALQTQAPERYVLGEMPDEEREAFEEHYFSCEVCADDLRELNAFVENAKAVLQTPPEPWPLRAAAAPAKPEPKLSGWRSWLRPPVLAGVMAAAFAAVVVMDQSTIRHLQMAQLVPAVVVKAEVRDQLKSFRQNEPISMILTLVDAPAPGSTLNAEIRSDSGTVKTIASTAPAENTPLNFFDPDPKLAPGHYDLVIGSTKYPFQIVSTR